MKNLLVICLIYIYNSTIGQIPQIEWQKTLGGTESDWLNKMSPTMDGGYILAGASKSDDGDVSDNHNSYWADYWIVKTDSRGFIQWQKMLGSYGFEDDVATDIHQTTDGGYIISGYSESDGGDVTDHRGEYSIPDYWIVKINSVGAIQWQRSLGGSAEDAAYSLSETSDGGYIVAGTSFSNDFDISSNDGLYGFFWIVKLDHDGNIEWDKSLGSSGLDHPNSIIQTDDLGYIIAGSTNSNDGDVTGNHGGKDYWIVKLDQTGNPMWQKCFGGARDDEAYSIKQTGDNGYIVAGYTNSDDGDVTSSNGLNDYWIVKLDSVGNLQWDKSLGGSKNDIAKCIEPTSDKGYILAGKSNSSDGDKTAAYGFWDSWITKIDSVGNLQWQKTLGGSFDDEAASILQNTAGNFVVGGTTSSADGDITNGVFGMKDYWLLKLSFQYVACPGVDTIKITSGDNLYGDSYQWQVNTGDGFVDISNNDNYYNTTTYELALINPPTDFYGYQYRCLMNLKGTVTNSTPITLKFATEWTGAQDTNWNNLANWSCGALPDANTDVMIPAGLDNSEMNPSINTTTYVRSLTVLPVSTVNVAPDVHLIVTGNNSSQ